MILHLCTLQLTRLQDDIWWNPSAPDCVRQCLKVCVCVYCAVVSIQEYIVLLVYLNNC